MYIKQLEFENFRRFKHLKMDLPFDEEGNPLPVVLIGVNGSGKSSILEGIAIFLQEAAQKRYDFKIDGLKIIKTDFRSQGGSQTQELSQKFTISTPLNDVSVFLKSEIKNEEQISTQFVNSDAFSLSSKIIHHDMSAVKYYSPSRGVFRERGSSIPRSNTERKKYYADSFNAKLTDFRSFLNWFEILENYENQEKVRLKKWEYVDKDLEYVRNQCEKVLSCLQNANLTELRIERNIIENGSIKYQVDFLINKHGEIFNLNQLSDGEKVALLLVSDIARKLVIADTQRGIILIDEIELHLHPSWQRTIVNALQQVFPTVQFIITTHSPLVISHVPQKSVFVIDENGQVTSMAQRPFNSYGADPADVLQMAQGVKEVIPPDLQKKLDHYFALINKNEIEAAKELQKEIEKMTDRSHPELIKGRGLIDFKEIIAK